MKTFTSILIVILITFAKSYPQNFWEKTSGPDTVVTNSLAVNSNGDIFAATTDGLLRSTDSGDTWLNLGIDESIRLVFISPNDEVFLTTVSQGPILRSTDNGLIWVPIGLASWQNSIAVNANGDIFAGTDNYGVYRTTDNGENWVQILHESNSRHITSLVINSNQDIFIGTIFGGVYRSTDNGENWVQVNQGLTTNYITSFAINSHGDIFAGTSGQGVFRSVNNGGNWVEINQGLGGESYWVRSIEINSLGDIFAGTADGVFRSSDNGENWIAINEGLINLNIRSLGINSENTNFAGTSGGIFRRENEITAVGTADLNNISSFNLFQNYPNPFNPATKIRWQSPVNSRQTLKIFDVLGNEVVTLVDEYKEAGRYEINFDASMLSSGIYFYQLNTGDFISMKKMILLK